MNVYFIQLKEQYELALTIFFHKATGIGQRLALSAALMLVFLSLSNLLWCMERPLVVDIEPLPPCVMTRDNVNTGFDVELWEAVAKELDLHYVYRVTDLKGIFNDMVKHKADVGFSCITITSEREASVDFSHPYLESGLRILVLDKSAAGIISPLKSFLSPLVLRVIFYLALFIALCGNVVWLVEGENPFISRKYYPGIFEAIWYVVVTMTTVGYGDVVPKKGTGRIIAVLIMVFGIGFFGWAIAQLSSAFTLQKLRSDIDHPHDLRSRIVATVENTTSVPALKNLGAGVKTVESIDQAYGLLLKEEVEAVVFDSPTVLYYEQNEGAGKVRTVGPLFEIQYYGFLFPQGSKLREPVNRALLRLQENGTYEQIYKKWFGANQMMLSGARE